MMINEINDLITISNQHFNKLKSTNKPNSNEWTTFASIISKSKSNELKCICLSLGTKSVSGDKAKLNNLIIDCHAESLCRRAFKYYLINKINQNQIDELYSSDYHLIISQLPCGVVNRYKGQTDPSLRKKPGRGELCSKSTCFDKLLKWQILGLQGRSLLPCIKKPIRFKSIIISNCSLELQDVDKDTFKNGFNLEILDDLNKYLRLFLSSTKLNEQNINLINEDSDDNKNEDNKNDDLFEPRRKKLKEDESFNNEHYLKDTNHLNQQEHNHTKIAKLNSSEIIDLIKPEIYFTDYKNEMFIKRDNKKAQDKSIIYYLNNVSNNDLYNVDIIIEGRKFGTTLKTYEKSILTLSPLNLDKLIKLQLENKCINLDNDNLIKNYDLLWNEMKKYSNFKRWLK